MTPTPDPPLAERVSRSWNEWLAMVVDPLWGGAFTLFLITLALALVAGLLWAYWPAWLPSRWRWSRRRGERADREKSPRVGGLRLRLRWRWRWRWRRRRTPDQVERLPDDEVPDLPAEVLTLSADELAAAGRWAEAVRERLRAILRGLIERGLAPAGPGWTVLELARAADRVRPELATPLNEAVETFSEIWYGLRPATDRDDAAMRAHAVAVSTAVADVPVLDAESTVASAGRPG